MPFLTTLNK